jgi:hypothetical protein
LRQRARMARSSMSRKVAPMVHPRCGRTEIRAAQPRTGKQLKVSSRVLSEDRSGRAKPPPRKCLELSPWHPSPDSLHARHGHTTSTTFCRSYSVNQKAGRQRKRFRRLVRLCPVRDCRCVGRPGAIQTRQLNPKTFRGRSRVCTDGEEDRILKASCRSRGYVVPVCFLGPWPCFGVPGDRRRWRRI